MMINNNNNNNSAINIEEIKDAIREAYYDIYKCINEEDINAICKYVVGIKEEK